MRNQYTKLPARAETREKFRAIAKAKDWSVTTAVAKAADALAERERIQLPSSRRRSA